MASMDEGGEARREAEVGLRLDWHAGAPGVESRSREDDTLLNGLFRLVPDGVFLADLQELRPWWTNPALCRMLGVSAKHLCSRGFLEHLGCRRQDNAVQRLRAALECGAGFGPERFDLRRYDGTRITVMLSAEAARGHDGRIMAWVRIEPVGARPVEEDDSLNLDLLTGLPNRRSFLSRLDVEISAARAKFRAGAVLLMELDDFEKTIELHGKSRGDSYLVAQAQRLRSAIGEGAFAARLGEDEFAVLLSDVDRPRDAKLRALDISAALSGGVKLGGATIIGSVSIGVALFPNDSLDADKLILNADTALCASKRAGGGVITFHRPSVGALRTVTARDRLRSDLARAPQNGELSMHFQPIVDIHSGRTMLFEALLRWQRPEAPQLSPKEFMHLAESNSAIDALRRFTIDEALRRQAQWTRRLGPVGVCVNISPAQIASDAALEWILDRVRKMSACELLVLEVTETSRFRENAQFERLAKLREAGVRISIDDFGTGYSTLDYLARIPADYLKLDRTFVAKIDDEKYRRLLRAAISLGKEFGMRIIAEGIETQGQVDLLRELGCDMGQGYHFGAPLRAAKPGRPRKKR